MEPMGAKQPNSPMTRSPARIATYLIASLFAAGLLLYISTVLSERMAVPVMFEPLSHGFYRVGYFIRLPMIVFLSPWLPMEGHHHVHLALSELLTSFTAPFFWCAVAAPIVITRSLTRRVVRSASLQQANITIPRRVFLIGAAGVIGGPGLLGGYAVLVEPQRLRIERYRMAVRDLPAALEGFRIVHVSDTHYGPFISLRYINGVVDQANALEGDLIVLTGDYVHRSPLAIGPGVHALKRLNARLGVLATLGNHDHWEGADDVRAACAEINLPLIDNARRFVSTNAITSEPVIGESICVGGLGDLWEDDTDFDRALADAPASMPRILLAHNPDTAEHVDSNTRVDFMCSGHTHGGQVWVPGLGTPVVPSAYGQKYAGGFCHGPHCPVIVSRGVGMAILPVRFGVPPEIGEITLVRA